MLKGTPYGTAGVGGVYQQEHRWPWSTLVPGGSFVPVGRVGVDVAPADVLPVGLLPRRADLLPVGDDPT